MGARVAIALEVFNENDELVRVSGPWHEVSGTAEVRYEVPQFDGYPIAKVGVLVQGGSAILRSMAFEGMPKVVLKGAKGKAWRNAWVNGVSEWNPWGAAIEPTQNEGTGLLIYGCREWQDISVKTKLFTNYATEFGVALRVQGMRRYVALLLHKDQTLRIVRCAGVPEVLVEAPFPWEFGDSVQFEFCAIGDRYYAKVGDVELKAVDGALREGATGLVVSEGRIRTEAFEIRPG
jgi:hypothetical protein